MARRADLIGPKDAGGEAPGAALRRYYQLHAPLYDLTRWAFLFGRRRLCTEVARREPVRVLEIGCGTGRNLDQLARLLPAARLTGADLSSDMLARARQRLGGWGARLKLWEGDFARMPAGEQHDAVVLSYVLTMTHPHTATLLAAAWQRVAPGGVLAIVDFHDSPLPLFRRWMALNHVRLQGELPGEVRELDGEVEIRRYSAFGGLWRYVQMVVHKPERRR
ncbi:MAG: class I SAM-dependent methyltransferase [Xanthomonadales bacterium]|jgi:S-adenosylmethionine-diacylgycerolhomoserine-N-methlytransferase|nr:class I SAM-dependent methyltransferase [Xanthomonadales bacterium]